MNAIPTGAFKCYLEALINKVYKILPMYEEENKNLRSYLQSLEREMSGCYQLYKSVCDDAQFLSLISIVSYLHTEEYTQQVCKQEVFKAIHIIEGMVERTGENG